MIIYGTRSSVRPGEALAAPCPDCQRPTLQSFRAFDYLHVYFIPTLPIGGSAGIECSECLHTRMGDEIPAELESDASQASSAASRPRWHWAGTLLACLLLGWLSTNGSHERELDLARLAAPVVGDLYVVDTSTHAESVDPAHPFVVARVVDVDDEQVRIELGQWFYTSRWEAQKAVNHDAADADAYFGGGDWVFSRGDLMSMDTRRELRVARRAGEGAM